MSSNQKRQLCSPENLLAPVNKYPFVVNDSFEDFLFASSPDLPPYNPDDSSVISDQSSIRNPSPFKMSQDDQIIAPAADMRDFFCVEVL